VQHERDRYRINAELRYEFDAARFEAEISGLLRLTRSEASTMEQLWDALSLCRGEFLEDEIVGAWHLEQRDHLRRLYVEVLLALGDALVEAAQYAEAAEVYQRIILKEDLQEVAHRRLMLCLARLDKHTLALRHYQRFAELLRDEMETEPEPETTELFERLRRGESV
jgi:DNA-binding SARP family transcriptional activator